VGPGLNILAAGPGGQGSALQGLVERFRGEVGQVNFGSTVADFQAKMGVAAGAGRSSKWGNFIDSIFWKYWGFDSRKAV